MDQMIATVELMEDGEYYFVFPDGLIESMGWEIGDTLIWEETLILDDEGETYGFTIRRK